MADTFDPKFGSFVTFAFTLANPDTGASGTNTYMTWGAGGVTNIAMPYAGSVVSLTVRSNANVTGATVAFNPQKAGTPYAQASSLLTTLTTAAGASNVGYANVRSGVLTFAAGDLIGVSYLTATNYAATTIDYDAVIVVQLNPT